MVKKYASSYHDSFIMHRNFFTYLSSLYSIYYFPNLYFVCLLMLILLQLLLLVVCFPFLVFVVVAYLFDLFWRCIPRDLPPHVSHYTHVRQAVHIH